MMLKQIVRPRWVTPNKLFDYMFAGIPTIVNFQGTTSELVEAEGAGVACKAGSAKDLADKIRYLTDHIDERIAMGQQSRKVAFQKYDRSRIARNLAAVFETVLSKRSKLHSVR